MQEDIENQQRNKKYDRLIKMIKQYQRPHEHIKILDQIKNDTIFQIHLKFMKCEHNKTYRFPKFTTEKQEVFTIEQMELANQKNILYNLNDQNKSRQLKQNSTRSKLYQFQQQVRTEKKYKQSTLSTSLSLNKIKTKYEKQRLDKFKQRQKELLDRIKIKNQRIETMISQSNKKSAQNLKNLNKRSTYINTLKSSANLSPYKKKIVSKHDNTNYKQLYIGTKPQKSIKKFKTQSTQKLKTLKKIEINQGKTSKIHDLIYNEIKKKTKGHEQFTNFTLENTKMKNKNIFQKLYF